MHLDRAFGEQQRKRSAFGPESGEVGKVRAGGRARLPGRIDRQRSIPIAKIGDYAQRRAATLFQIDATSRHHRVSIPPPVERTHVESPSGRGCRRKRMVEERAEAFAIPDAAKLARVV